MDRLEARPTLGGRVRRPLAWTLAAGLVFAAGAAGAAGDAGPASPTSCVACHTDLARLQEEAKGIPAPAGSALQAGKG